MTEQDNNTEPPHALHFIKNVDTFRSQKDPYIMEYQAVMLALDAASRLGKRSILYNPISDEQHFGRVLEYLEKRFTPEMGYKVEFKRTGGCVVGQDRNGLLYQDTGAIQISF